MATGMKLWLTLTLAGVAMVAAWKLPPSPYAPREAVVRPGETLRSEALNEEFRVTAEALRRWQWSDSLAPLALSSADDGVALLYPGEAGLNVDQLQRFDGMIRSEVESLRGSDMVFGYVLQAYDAGQTPDMPNAARDRTELYVGSLEGQSYCLQVRVHHPRRAGTTLARKLTGEDRSVRPVSGSVGTCRPYLQHGLPGPEIQAWMEEGGVQLATERGEVSEDDTPFQSPPERRMVFGISYGFAIEGDRCLAGYSDACAALLTNATDAEERNLTIARMSPVTAIAESYFRRSRLPDQEYLFYDLEQEFGSEAFGEFWTSEHDVETAFAAAFGIDFGEWIVSWVDGTLGVDEPAGGGLGVGELRLHSERACGRSPRM